MKIKIKVITNAKSSKLEKISQGEYKAWLTAQPIEGKANKMLIHLLAKHFGVAKSKIVIVQGITNKQKIIEIDV
ncbi:TPA: hypothetical protein DF272_00075 [Candidatus Falkowbacteria bacterium]|nr:hypothetical protein [Candidatus Falkowbacteria bacterium]